MSFIYKITNLLNDKCYIGKTDVHTIEERFKEHIKDSKRYLNRPLYRAFNKYGVENFQIEEIEQCSIKESSEREKFWINYYNSFHNGYNATLGGDGKSYIDRELVIKTYKTIQNQTETAKKLNISQDTVRYILKNANVEIIKSGDITKKRDGHAVSMIDIKSKRIIQNFEDQSDAARWLMSQGKTTIKDYKKVSYIIGRAARGLRKTAYGYIWKLI